jgi:outer membrane protein assembly factor BamB
MRGPIAQRDPGLPGIWAIFEERRFAFSKNEIYRFLLVICWKSHGRCIKKQGVGMFTAQSLTTAGFFARSRFMAALSTVVMTAVLAVGCGGDGGSPPSGNTGGSPGNLSLSISVKNISVSATVAQSAPTASFQVSIVGEQPGQKVYLSGKYSANGIATISDASGSSPVAINIQFKSPSSLGAGVYTDTVQISGCYDQACTQPLANSPQEVQVQYTVTGSSAKLISLNPPTAVAQGNAFTLTANGSNFTQQSQVMWNGNSRVTTYVSATQLTTQITAADIAAAGSVPVSVTDPVNGTSNSLVFTIQAAPLSLSSISPTNVTVGGTGFMLTVLGTGFTNTSTVRWNGVARPTTVVAGNELVAQIGAADIAAVGTVSVTVNDPSSNVGTTSPQTLTISAASIDAVAFQMNSAHTGDVNFASISFPANPVWSVDVGGTPSYALIVQGKIFVTVSVGSGSSQLVALDQATGATVWGPIAIGGTANAAYDSGKVFVISSPFATAATIEAFDAQSGNQLWSTLLTGQYSFTGGLTAANGFVYAGGAGSGGTLYAVDQATGAITWTQQVQNGDNSTPAVTADGVYVTYPCWTYDFRPATGESVWNNNTGCEGGGGATPVVANQLVYSPNEVSGYNGTTYNAETGALSGTYTADSPSAFTASTGYFLQGGTLRGISVASNTVQWSFAGDGQLSGAPIAVNQYVFIGSGSGNLYALDGTTGQLAWQVTLPAPVVWQLALPLSGLAAGDGLLVVPAGTKVTAYMLSTNP